MGFIDIRAFAGRATDKTAHYKPCDVLHDGRKALRGGVPSNGSQGTNNLKNQSL